MRGLRIPEDGGFANNGYYLDGITSQLSLGKRFYLSDWCFINLETKVNVAYAKVDVVNGYAKVPVVAFAALLGLGIEL